MKRSTEPKMGMMVRRMTTTYIELNQFLKMTTNPWTLKFHFLTETVGSNNRLSESSMFSSQNNSLTINDELLRWREFATDATRTYLAENFININGFESFPI